MYVRGALQKGNPIWIAVRSAIGGQVDQPGIDQRPAHSEVIQVLMPQAREAEHAVHHIIEKAAYSAAAKALCLA